MLPAQIRIEQLPGHARLKLVPLGSHGGQPGFHYTEFRDLKVTDKSHVDSRPVDHRRDFVIFPRRRLQLLDCRSNTHDYPLTARPQAEEHTSELQSLRHLV